MVVIGWSRYQWGTKLVVAQLRLGNILICGVGPVDVVSTVFIFNKQAVFIFNLIEYIFILLQSCDQVTRRRRRLNGRWVSWYQTETGVFESDVDFIALKWFGYQTFKRRNNPDSSSNGQMFVWVWLQFFIWPLEAALTSKICDSFNVWKKSALDPC